MWKPSYFPALDVARGLAAIAVVLCHVSENQERTGLPSLYQKFKFLPLGYQSVLFFFVMSGFLITLLLLEESNRTGTIDIKAFYLKRALRILPLYYLIIGLGFFILPLVGTENLPIPFPTHPTRTLLLFLLFQPVLAAVFDKPMPGVGQTWSLLCEEQFYLIWPWVIRKAKQLPLIVAAILMGKFLLLQIVVVVLTRTGNLPWLNGVHVSIREFFIEHLSIGALGAYYFYSHRRFVARFFLGWQTTLFLTLAITVCFLHREAFTHGKYWPGIGLSFLYLILVLNLVTAQSLIPKIWLRPFLYFGRISYGIYMYHNLIVMGLFACAKRYGFWNLLSIGGPAMVPLVTLILTVGIASLSYRYLERPILDWGTRKQLVRSLIPTLTRI